MDQDKMSSENAHPSRGELFESLKKGHNRLEKHLQSCPDCRSYRQLLELIYPSGDPSILETADEAHQHRLEAIPILKADACSRRRVAGKLAYDSWSGLSPVQIRDAARGFERRLRLKAGQVELEIVAERELAIWKFSARIYVNDEVSGDFVLKVGRRKLTPQFGRCFFWSAERPPRTVYLLGIGEEIVFGSIPWPKE